MIPVVDGHHHIWRQADLPWLVGPMQPRIFGPYEPIRRDYPIEEFRADIAGSDVVKSVYVQTNWAPERLRGRGRLGAADGGQRQDGRTRSSPTPISAPTTCARSSIGFRATRSSAACACNCIGTRTRNTASPRGVISSPIPTIRRNIGRLADYGLSFDLQVFAPQMADAADLAEVLPEGRLRAAARRHARGSLARGTRGMARRHGAPGRLPQCGLQALRTRHLPASQRSCACRRRGPRDRRDLRRRPLPVRVELSDREALDLLWRARRSLSRRREPVHRSRNSKRSCTTRR